MLPIKLKSHVSAWTMKEKHDYNNYIISSNLQYITFYTVKM